MTFSFHFYGLGPTQCTLTYTSNRRLVNLQLQKDIKISLSSDPMMHSQNSPEDRNMAERCFEGKAHAVAYKRYRVSPPQELMDEVLHFLEKRSERLFNLAVDVGCGSGQGTVLLAPHFTTVVGTDISPAQIEQAKSHDHASNVSYRQCPAEELPFESGTVDLVTSMTAAHWFDRPRFLREADRILKLGGCIALISYTLNMELEFRENDAELNRICQEFYTALLPFRSSYLGPSSLDRYKEMYESIPYQNKEWHECLRVRRKMPLTDYIGMVETFSSYQALLKKDPAQAQKLSEEIMDKLLNAMGTSSADTEVTVVIKYFYLLASKDKTD
ncbi:putative methyltransferase DDB_G0268948 [Chanos chanos]|uniref:Methyltransferase DDB_G0268948 n=1 Tax=Chanos chanos TaxID=29144 RepID=A0A6J2VUV0_CHACN|nr:putative methyltransferase DDB_G0268948 [Chanos chanos]